MGQTQNGRLYIMYRSSSQKTNQRSAKSVQTTVHHCFSNAKITIEVSLTFNKAEKTNLYNFNFVHLFSFLFISPNLKSIQCMQILNIPSDCSANLLHSYLF